MNLAWTTDPLWLVLNSLMAYRLTQLWVSDDLPPLPMVRLWLWRRAERAWIKRTHPKEATAERWEKIEDLKRQYSDEPPVTALWTCYACAGFWMCVGVTLGASLIPLAVWTFAAVPFAMSTVIGLLAARTH